MALRVITGNGVGNGARIGRNGNGHNGNGHNGNGRNGNGVEAPPAGSRNFLRHLRDMVGQTVTVATTCGMVRGVLGQVFEDHVLVRHNGTEQHVRVKQICFVSAERSNGR